MKCQQIPAEVESAWEYIKNGLLEAADETFEQTRGGCSRHKETWWWNNEVNNAVIEKRKAWKQWKNGGTKELHKAAKTAGYFAKSEAKTEQLKDRTASINNNSDKNHIFKMTKRLKRDNVDVVSKCIRNDDGKLTVTVGDKLKAW